MGWGQGPTPQADTAGVDSVLPFVALCLSGPWQLRGSEASYEVPFQLPMQDTARLRLTLARPEGVSEADTLYIYVPGVAWEAELLLNQYYLGVNPRPFAPWVVPVAVRWLRPEGNQLALRLQSGPARRHEPRPFLGVFRELWLLSAAELALRRPAPLPEADSTRPVGLLAPYYGPAYGYRFDSLAALRRLLPLRREGIRQVACWYEPGPNLRALCRTLGLRLVQLPPPGTSVALINAYPYDPGRFDQPPQFWLDEQGRRTVGYGRIQPWQQASPLQIPAADRVGLALLLLWPLFGAFLIKLSSPGFFAAQGAMLRQPTPYIENTFYSNVSSTGALLLLTLVRVLTLSCCVTLLAYYCARHQLWAEVSLLTKRSLFFQVFGEISQLARLWLVSVLVVALLEGIRHLLMWLVGQVFRLKGLLSSMVSLDLVGSYPLVLLLGIPLGLLLLGDVAPFWLGQAVAWLTFGSYWLRKVYVTYQGLDKGASFSSEMKILYICSFNMTPLLIWL